MKTRKLALVGALAFAAAALIGCAEDKATTCHDGACSGGDKACSADKASGGCCKDAAAKTATTDSAAPVKN
jgi:hypothetical protein